MDLFSHSSLLDWSVALGVTLLCVRTLYRRMLEVRHEHKEITNIRFGFTHHVA